jgi:hypothetical protein
MIGHQCRDALLKFAAELAGVQGVKLDAGDGIVDRLRHVIRSDDQMSKGRVRCSLN